MDYKGSLKYFTHKGLIALIGTIMFFAAIILTIPFLIAWGMWGIYSYLPFIVVGLIMMVFGRGGVMNDAEYDGQTERLKENIKYRVLQAFDMDDDKHVKTLEPIIFNEYEFKDDPAYLYKKGKDGKMRSNMYMFAVLLFGPEKMYVYTRHVNLTDENTEEVITKNIYSYTDLKKAEAVNEAIKGKIKEKEVTLEFLSFKVFSNNDETIMSIPVQNDALTDQRVDGINKLITKVKARKAAESNQDQ
ncbi:MAG: hypothetical protein FWF15_08400 [Oscillospiraceae bacterium]|nr:hypothetical protein [Oscillospiraceae bacterium]